MVVGLGEAVQGLVVVAQLVLALLQHLGLTEEEGPSVCRGEDNGSALQCLL